MPDVTPEPTAEGKPGIVDRDLTNLNPTDEEILQEELLAGDLVNDEEAGAEALEYLTELGGDLPEGAESVELDLRQLGEDTAAEARNFVRVVRAISSGASPETAMPLLLLALSQVLVTGARLGAIQDVVPGERFEPDTGRDPEVSDLRDGLGAVLEGLDEYVEALDPITAPELAGSQISADLTEIAEALLHGLHHHAEGRVTEALWWWQFSYLSSWGGRAASALRALHSILSHVRLDADEDTVLEAEFEALHRD